MSMICSICQGALTERPQELQGQTDELIICTLCLWPSFSSKLHHQMVQHSQGFAGTCPYCIKRVSLTDAIRIFPTCEEERDGESAVHQELRTVKSEKAKLEVELRNANNALEQTQSALATEKAQHRATREQYARATCQLSSLQADLQTSVSTEQTLLSKIENLEKEKKRALHQIRLLKADNTESQSRLERLRGLHPKTVLRDLKHQLFNKFVSVS